MGNWHEYYRKRIVSLQKQHRDVLHRITELESENAALKLERDDLKERHLSRQASYVIACEALQAENTKLRKRLELKGY